MTRHRNCYRCAVTAAMLLPLMAAAQTFPSYYSASDLSVASPGALRAGLYGYENPAMLTYVRQPDAEFIWTDATGKWNSLNRWGLFTASPDFGFALVKTKTPTASITDYRISVGFGDRTFGGGLAYSFVGGDKSAFDRRNAWTLGLLIRPTTHLSLGLIGSTTGIGERKEAAVDLALRPFGNELITAFADCAIQNRRTLKQGNWSLGAVAEPLPGLRITGRWFDSHAFSLGFSVSLGRAGLSTATTFDRGGREAFHTYAIRSGAFDRTILTGLEKGTRVVTLDLKGPMTYQRFRFFDGRNTLKGMLESIAAARDDERIAGIAINTSGMEINREMLWELRTQLADLRAAGKSVVIFVDRPSMEDYGFATVADMIVMDPLGMLTLPGYAMGGTYLKGLLDKLGIGFDELRFFKYKSAVEALSRTGMSDADREQRQRFVDDLYASLREQVCAGRRISPGQFDAIVDDSVIFRPAEAVAQRLVDTLGRWEERQAIVEHLAGKRKALVEAGALAYYNEPYDARWGEPPAVAVIYALGECAMDAGIKARSLAKIVEAAGRDPRIKAIVLRVDSPGGDGMASDYVAEALKKAKRNKPVIVSQGSVAASGGYWLSMYADTIVASPVTITGSIGVIAGWAYNTEFKEKLGLSTDYVKAGKHAELGFGMRVPLLDVTLPDRDLTELERGKFEQMIRASYVEFVGKVAEGRKTTPEQIEPLAQGHFYSGREGKRIGLVDVLGGLDAAIAVARERAGIRREEEITVMELPPPPLFDLSRLIPLPFPMQAHEDPIVQHLRFRLEHNGEPMPIMPLEDLTVDVPRE